MLDLYFKGDQGRSFGASYLKTYNPMSLARLGEAREGWKRLGRGRK